MTLEQRVEYLQERIILHETAYQKIKTENIRFRAIIRSVLDALDNGSEISVRDIAYMREISK